MFKQKICFHIFWFPNLYFWFMLKRLLFFLLLISILCFLVFSIFQRLGEQSKVFQEPQKYFPADPILFVEVNEFSKTLHHFFETSMIWSKFEEVSKNNQYGELIKEINLLMAKKFKLGALLFRDNIDFPNFVHLGYLISR